MGQVPFGFNPDDSDDPGQQPGAFNLADLGAALSQLGSMLQGAGSGGTPTGGVNWDQARDVARREIAAGSDPVVGDSQRRRVQEAIRIAEVWVDESTTFPSTGATGRAWSRSEWLEATMPAWQEVIEPVAEEVLAEITGMLTTDGDPTGGLPEELRAMLGGVSGADLAAMLGPLKGMAQVMSANMFAMQVGQALASLAGEVVSAGDVGLPLTTDGIPTLLPGNVASFGAGLGVDSTDVELYVALREVALQRLFKHVPWLAPRVVGAVEEYARGIGLNPGRMQEALKDVDPTDPASIQAALSSGVLTPEESPEQAAALARLETLLALIEGWVDHVVTASIGGRLASGARLQEAVRRRRAAGGPAEVTFAQLVGLELRPRRLRDAATLWSLLEAERGIAGRDAVWGHPDLLPGPADLDDPSGFVSGSSISDADLEALTSGAPGGADPRPQVGGDAAGSEGTAGRTDPGGPEADPA